MSVYVTVGALDTEKSNRFYDATLATIGWRSHVEFPGWRAYSKDGSGQGTVLWVCRPFDGKPASPGNGAMVGFMTNSRAEVDAFYAAALDNGGTDEGGPNPRPQYGPNWYAAYLRDPAGNKLSIVCNS
jgi:catechol 2,3-dioxygenase-like lactoylglutathione lyase family enzyme